MIFELAQDFHDAVATMPRGHPRHRLLELFEEAIRRDIHFIDRHPTTLFQCMWNLCWWYDSPEAAKYYEEPEGGWSPGEPPWEQGGARQSELLDAWRCAKEMTTPGFSWIRSMRPALLSGGAIRCVLRGHACPVQHVEFAAEGRQLVSGSAHLQVQNPLPTESIWYNGKQVPVAAPAKHPYPIVDNSIRVWDAFSGRQLMCVDSADGPVRSCAVAPDGESIAYAGSAQGTVEVIEVSSGERGACFHGHRAMVNGVTFSPDGACIASASGDGTIRIREARTGADVRCLRGHRSPVMCVAFSPDGRLLVSGSRTFAAPGENALRLWDAATGETIASVDLPDGAGIVGVAFSPGGSKVAAACLDHRVLLFTIAERSLRERVLGTHDGEVLSVAFDPEGRRVVSGSIDRTVRVWNVHEDQAPLCLRGHLDVVNSVAFSPDGRSIASASADGSIIVWDPECRSGDVRLLDHERDIVGLALAAEGIPVVSASQDGTLRVWDPHGVQLQVRPDHPEVRQIAISPGGERAFSADFYTSKRSWTRLTRRFDWLSSRFLSVSEGPNPNGPSRPHWTTPRRPSALSLEKPRRPSILTSTDGHHEQNADKNGPLGSHTETDTSHLGKGACMSWVTRWFGTKQTGSQQKLCPWLIKNMEGGLSAAQITEHVKSCAICRPAMAARRKERPSSPIPEIDPATFPTTMMIGIDGPFDLGQVLALARKNQRELVVMGWRSPAFKDQSVLFREAPKFTDDDSLVLIYEKQPNKEDASCLDPMVIVRRTFLLDVGSSIRADALGELAIVLAIEASKKNLSVSTV